jgi:putative hydrolase of the HAD superfamily
LRELELCLADGGLNINIFDRDLCFWSYQHGFSKPDAHVFQFLRLRLEERGINPVEVLMVGDRPDNDIDPARKHGFQTWLLSGTTADKTSGSWQKLGEFLACSV